MAELADPGKTIIPGNNKHNFLESRITNLEVELKSLRDIVDKLVEYHIEHVDMQDKKITKCVDCKFYSNDFGSPMCYKQPYKDYNKGNCDFFESKK